MSNFNFGVVVGVLSTVGVMSLVLLCWEEYVVWRNSRLVARRVLPPAVINIPTHRPRRKTVRRKPKTQK